MPTSPTDPGAGATLLAFIDDGGAIGAWRLIEGDAVIARGGGDLLPDDAARAVLAVPGTEVAIHWLDLADDLTLAQATAAARLMLADSSAEPLADMHVAVGRREAGKVPAALVPARTMLAWIDAAASVGMDADAIVPAPMLIAPPVAGIVQHGVDHRGPATAFAIEPELAAAILGEAPVALLAEADYEAGLPALAADPALDLRQGPFARRRHWRLESGAGRRLVLLAAMLVLLTLAVPVAKLILTNRAAARMEAEAAALAQRPATGADSAPGFALVAPALFDAVRATPNAELGQVDYRADGSLAATVLIDSPATLDMLATRIEAAGLSVERGQIGNRNGRAAAELLVRPA